MNPFFSLIIPCYNDGRYEEGVYLDRLLQSVCKQGIEKNDLQVILVDDCSPVLFNNILDKFSSRLNLTKITTEYNFAPGNSRQKGVEIAEGQWLCFADHDDIFPDNSLSTVKAIITKTGQKYFAFADFEEVDLSTGKVIEKFEHSMTWVHAKFYNRENFWNKYQIEFPKDLKTHEDIAISGQVNGIAVCHKEELGEFLYIPLVTYLWNHNEESVSHSKYVPKLIDGKAYGFWERHFDDYLRSTLGVILDQLEKGVVTERFAVRRTLSKLMDSYFMISSFHHPFGDPYT